MNKPGYTEGKWSLTSLKIGYMIKADTGCALAICSKFPDDSTRAPECLPNALLMAAAPEMFEALKAVFNARAPQFNFDFSSAPDMQKVIDAIKKAEGIKS